ncbi:MAG TPA: hypothetical protein VNJ54_18770 [Plantibacter sp.]|uniref:hypothetical protein n=1 Tax=unclassified Plantibacter TaxID=2624265 RepID=UPI002C564A3A|nr:hypothetical protein [Plantibacter sp.]
MKAMKKVGGAFANYPFFVSVFVVALVLGHFLLSQKYPILNVAFALTKTTASDAQGTLTSLSLGVAGVSAMVGGFAGVVVVFGLGSENDRFRLLRRRGNRRLRANWISVVLSSFSGAFGALVAAVMVVGFGIEPGMWVLEACLLFTAHAAIRLTALLAGLASIVDSQDEDTERAERVVPTHEIFPDPPTTEGAPRPVAGE